MANLIDTVVRETLAKLRPVEPSSDAALLDRFVTRCDETAFAEIVRLHGPMVWRVCQRVLRQTQDAEDAFQATFVVLARKAASLSRRHLLGGWLHGVAHRVALESRRLRGRRDERRQPLRAEPAIPVAAVAVEPEWKAALDEEIARLPARYRLPLVLCDLEGKTSEAAAQELGIPAGTVRRRLSHVREQLRQRLARRGVTFSAAALPAVLAQEAAGSVPVALATATTHAASVALAGGVIAAPVRALVQAYQAHDTGRRLTLVATAALLLLVGVGGLAWWLAAGAPPRTRIAAESIRVRATLPHDDFVYRLAFAPNGQALYCTSFDGQVRRWNPATGQAVPTGFKDLAFSLAVARDGKTMAVGSWMGTIQLWDLEAGRAVATYAAFDFVPDRLSWDLRVEFSEALGRNPSLNAGGTTGVAFSPDGRWLAVGRERYPRICLYEVAQLRQPRSAERRIEITGAIGIRQGEEKRTYSATVLSRRPERFLTHERGVRMPAFSPDGQLLAAAGLNETVLWDVASGAVRGTVGGHRGTISAVQFSPDARMLVTTGQDGWLCTWRPDSLRALRSWNCSQGAVCDVAFSPDGRVLATAGANGTVRLWEPATGKLLATLQHGNDRAASLAFAPDGQTLATAGFDKTVKLWDLSQSR